MTIVLNKNHKYKFLVGMFLAASLMNTGAVQAYATPNGISTASRPIPERAATLAPIGFQVFCLQNPGECKSSSRASTNYSQNLMQLLEQVNRRVNRSIVARNDRGVDKWSLNVRYGDCEDFVLAKRSMLVEAGVSSGALRIATAVTRGGINHAVLVVRTNSGDLVLDNLTGAIKPWNETGLQMLAISGANPMKWRIIG